MPWTAPRMPLILAVAAILALSGAGTALATGTYAGWLTIDGSDNDDPMVLTTDVSGSQVAWVGMALRPQCPDGRSYPLHHKLPVRAVDGPGAELIASHNDAGQLSAVLHALTFDDTHRYTESGTFAGAFGPTSARGTLKITIAVSDRQTHKRVMTCRTPRLHWTLRRKLGRFYGGMTSQGEPTVMTLSSNRKRVQDFGVDFHARCWPSGFGDLPDWSTNFRIRAGHFGDTFSFPDDFGNLRQYGLSGRVSPQRATGTIDITVTAPDVLCPTGRLRWHMRSG